MGEPADPEPSEEELVAFAHKHLGGIGRLQIDLEALRESVREARELWVKLYRVAQTDDGSSHS